LALAASATASTETLADEPTQKPAAEGAAPTTPPVKTPAWQPKPKKSKLPVTLTVTALSPDPPWVVRIENTGESPIRIPADMRLLSFDLKSTRYDGKTANSVKKCSLPRAMVPSSFPLPRELYLQPGELYEEAIDPRLYCFGDSIDLLRPGSIVVPRFGFGPSSNSRKEPFAAQGTDRPEAFEAHKEIIAAAMTLPPLPKPPPAPASTSPVGEAGKDAGPPHSATQGVAPPAPPPTASKKDPDRLRGDIDIYVSRTSDAGAARDVQLTIRAVNEGRRQLAAVLRGRMLQFVVEELAPDNTARRRVECAGQNAAHGIATEMVGEVNPGREVHLPLLVAEMCPRGTFPKPGLYRVTPILDAAMSGESLKLDPWLGTALALQSTLARVATAREPFYSERPVIGSLKPDADAPAEKKEKPPQH